MAEQVYAVPDLTKKVRYGRRERGEREDRIVDIYVSADNLDPEPETLQDAVQQNTAQQQRGGSEEFKKNLYKAASVCLGLLCVILLAGITCLGVHNLSNMVEKKQLTEELDQLQANFDQMMTSHNNLTAQKDQLQSSFDQLKTSFDQMNISHNTLTEEREDMKMRLCETPGWQKHGRGCYYISTEKKNWEKSRQWCRDRQSDLIIIKSKEKQDFVKRASKKGVWLGLTDKTTERSFKWVDGTSLTTPMYWQSEQPNNAARDSSTEQDCVEFFEYGWNDRSCSVDNYWICERVLC